MFFEQSQDFIDSIKNQDQIFETLCSKEKYQDNDQCLVCNKDVVTGFKHHCKFCGFMVCKECSPKKRENPQKKNDFQTICDICDEKYIRQTLIDTQKLRIQKYDEYIQEGEQQLENLQKMYLEKLKKNREEKEKCTKQHKSYSGELDNLQDQADENIINMKGFEKKGQEMEDEQRYLNNKLSECKDEQNHKQSMLNNLKNDLQLLENEIQEMDEIIVQEQQWLANTNQKVTDFNIDNKAFKSILHQKKNNTQTMESNVYDQADTQGNDIFLYEEDEDDYDLINSEVQNILKQGNLTSFR